MAEIAQEITEIELAQRSLANSEELQPSVFPRLDNISAAFFYNYIPIPREQKTPEFIYVSIDGKARLAEEENTQKQLAVSN